MDEEVNGAGEKRASFDCAQDRLRQPQDEPFGRAQDGPFDCAQDERGDLSRAAERIVPNKNRRLQVAPTRRKLFTAAMKADFLEWLAATCNVCLSARRTGIHYRTALRHRTEDPVFAEAWARALDQGLARLEAKLVETRIREEPIALDGDREAPEMEAIDPWLALQLLREHRRNLYGKRRPGRRPRMASNAEVRAALVKRLAIFGFRVTAETEAEGTGAGPEQA